MDDCGSVTRHMKASRTRQSGMAMWRAEVIMEAGGHSLEKACLPLLCNMHAHVWARKEIAFVERRVLI